MAVRGDDQVLGLDVAVDDAGLVGLLQARGHLRGDLERPEHVQLAPLDQRLDGLALDQLHGDEEALGALVDVVDLRDRRVIDGARGARLLEEAGLAALVPRQLGRQELERHGPAEAGVARLVDDAHAALAEQLLDLVVLDRPPDHRFRMVAERIRRAQRPDRSASKVPGLMASSDGTTTSA